MKNAILKSLLADILISREMLAAKFPAEAKEVVEEIEVLKKKILIELFGKKQAPKSLIEIQNALMVDILGRKEQLTANCEKDSRDVVKEIDVLYKAVLRRLFIEGTRVTAAEAAEAVNKN